MGLVIWPHLISTPGSAPTCYANCMQSTAVSQLQCMAVAAFLCDRLSFAGCSSAASWVRWNSMGPTPSRTSSPTSARGSSRGKSVCPQATTRTARRSTPTCPTRALFLARISVRDARVYTCKRVLYTI